MPQLDDFNRADNTVLGSNWDQTGTAWYGGAAVDPDIVSNQAKAVPTGYSMSWWVERTFPSNCYVKSQVVSVAAVTYSHSLLLIPTSVGTSSAVGYQLEVNGSAGQINGYRSTSSVDTTIIGPVTQTVSASDTLMLALVATDVRLYYLGAAATGWKLLGSATDNTYRSSATSAVLSLGQNSIADNFSAGDWRDLVVRDYQKPVRAVYLRRNI